MRLTLGGIIHRHSAYPGHLLTLTPTLVRPASSWEQCAGHLHSSAAGAASPLDISDLFREFF